MFLHDYAVIRAGPSAVSQWTLYACTTDSYPCTDWAAISQSSLTSAWAGAVPVHVTSDLNRPSQFFRMALQGAASGEDPIVVQEIAVSLSGLAVEAAMYPESVVTVGETVAIQPQPFEGDAVFAISPALPASLTLDAATGAITGAGAGHFAANWNVYTVTRTLNGETKRFTLVLVDGRRERKEGGNDAQKPRSRPRDRRAIRRRCRRPRSPRRIPRRTPAARRARETRRGSDGRWAW